MSPGGAVPALALAYAAKRKHSAGGLGRINLADCLTAGDLHGRSRCSHVSPHIHRALFVGRIPAVGPRLVPHGVARKSSLSMAPELGGTGRMLCGPPRGGPASSCFGTGRTPRTAQDRVRHDGLIRSGHRSWEKSLYDPWAHTRYRYDIELAAR